MVCELPVPRPRSRRDDRFGHRGSHSKGGSDRSSIFARLSLSEMPSGGNVFEISDIQEDESEALVHAVENVTMLHSLGNSSMEFLRTTVGEGITFSVP